MPFGPISNNTGGLAEMAQLDEWVRECTDVLETAGHTTVAMERGFATGLAALVSLALFGAFCVHAEIHVVWISFTREFSQVCCLAS